jgi:hypothetical protein
MSLATRAAALVAENRWMLLSVRKLAQVAESELERYLIVDDALEADACVTALVAVATYTDPQANQKPRAGTWINFDVGMRYVDTPDRGRVLAIVQTLRQAADLTATAGSVSDSHAETAFEVRDTVEHSAQATGTADTAYAAGSLVETSNQKRQDGKFDVGVTTTTPTAVDAAEGESSEDYSATRTVTTNRNKATAATAAALAIGTIRRIANRLNLFGRYDTTEAVVVEKKQSLSLTYNTRTGVRTSTVVSAETAANAAAAAAALTAATDNSMSGSPRASGLVDYSISTHTPQSSGESDIDPKYALWRRATKHYADRIVSGVEQQCCRFHYEIIERRYTNDTSVAAAWASKAALGPGNGTTGNMAAVWGYYERRERGRTQWVSYRCVLDYWSTWVEPASHLTPGDAFADLPAFPPEG